MQLYELTAHELKTKLKNKEVKPSEIINSYLTRIKEIDPKIKAYVTVCEQEAIKQAQNIDNLYEKGEDLPELAGIPIGIKDNICTEGLKTTCSSKMLENFIPPYNATVMKKLNNQKTIILGKLNLDEFAMGGSTENSAFFTTKNPWNLNKVPGGSSGGSTAAVIANIAPWALGSDTGGSIRQPSSFCGTVGLKPTYGSVSRYGLVAFASSLDQIGPITKDVEDSALLFNHISGYDELDSTSIKQDKKDYTKSLINDVKGLKIGIPKEYIGHGINEEVKQSIIQAAKKYEEMGAIIEEFELGGTEYALATYYIICCAEASSNLGRFDGIRYGYRTKNYETLEDIYINSRSEAFGPEVKRRIMLGTYVLSSGYYDAYYKKAQKVRTIVRNAFNNAFTKYDVLLTPTSPTVAFDIGSKCNNPLEMYLADICTVPINIAGVPAISIPCGYDKQGMPIGMQIIGKHFDEQTLFKVAYSYEKNTSWLQNKPEFKI